MQCIESLVCLLCAGLSLSSVSACEKLEIVSPKQEHVRVPTRSCINLIDNNHLLAGKRIDLDGSIINDELGGGVVTNHIRVHIGDLWYQKVIYLHTCCEFDGKYDFCSQRVALFDENKKLLENGIIDDIETAIILPVEARYAIIQYPKDATMLFASITNRSLLNSYSEYDDNLLFNEETEQYDTIVNSDGAITVLLKTGFDYLGRYELDFGYGSHYTMFNSECQKGYSNEGLYEGLKYQMDCSSFVQAALLGVPYQESRYYLGTEAHNNCIHKIFQFDQFAEYNYYMLAYPEECGADYGRMYANKIAKYFYDRGLLFKVNPDLSNLKTGDLLFWGNGGFDKDFFLDIGHVAICSDSWKDKFGQCHVKIIQSLSEKSCDYSSELKYAARVPLSEIQEEYDTLTVDALSIIKNVEIKKGEQQLLATIELTEELRNREIYTMLLTTILPEGISLSCRVNQGNVTIGRDVLYNSYNSNIIENHFGFYRNEMGQDKSQLYIFINAEESYNGEIIINDVLLLSGYHNSKECQIAIIN